MPVRQIGKYEMLGLSASGIRSQIIVARVKDIDVAKLRAQIDANARGKGMWAEMGLPIADAFPQQVIDVGLPFARKKLLEFGIDADLSVANAPPPARPKSEFLPGMAVGAGMLVLLGALAFGIVKLTALLRA